MTALVIGLKVFGILVLWFLFIVWVERNDHKPTTRRDS